MPVRDMDMFASSQGASVVVGANRGASGIDGLVATAVGFAQGTQQPLTAVIGDLAFLHDLNSLSLLKESAGTLILIVINNDGGGIFSFLPPVNDAAAFSKFFATPHGMTFKDVIKGFGIPYAAPRSIVEFKKVYLRAVHNKAPLIIEIKTDREQNLLLHRQIQEQVKHKI
jgi:2-succinyl-5-enolpyruvyl-6-hydroxy-3-cyclohexene-1-carboxylate synthase